MTNVFVFVDTMPVYRISVICRYNSVIETFEGTYVFTSEVETK